MTALPHQAWDGFLLKEQRQEGDKFDPKTPIAALRAQLFELQRRMIDSPARRQVRKPGRRGGKTKANAAELLLAALEHPGDEISLYITLTKHHSRRNLERELDKQIAALGLPLTKGEVDQQLQYRHKEGHVIWLTGCKDKSEADKLRGDKFRLAIIDEAGSGLFNRVIKGDVEGSRAVTLLQYLCQSVLSAALSDLGGRLVICGTPWVLPSGFFFEVSTGANGRKQWETWEWTVLDNPFHRYSPENDNYDEQAFKEEARDDWGCELFTEEELAELWEQQKPLPYPRMPWLKKASASFEREYLSLWVRDTEALCYDFAESRNSFHAAEAQGLISRDAMGNWVLPQGDWKHVLTIDLGHDDQTTFCVASSRRNFPHVYYRKAFGRPGMTTSQRAAEAHRLRRLYNIRGETVVDTGGLGKAIAHDMTTDYGLPARAAEKSAKASAIRNLRDDQRRGVVFIDTRECAELVVEMQTVTWNADRDDHDESCVDDNCDGALYNHREHKPGNKLEEVPPEPGTREAIDKAQRERKQRLGKRAAIMRDESLSPAQRRAKLRREGLG